MPNVELNLTLSEEFSSLTERVGISLKYWTDSVRVLLFLRGTKPKNKSVMFLNEHRESIFCKVAAGIPGASMRMGCSPQYSQQHCYFAYTCECVGEYLGRLGSRLLSKHR